MTLREWRTDLSEAGDCILLTKAGDIVSGEWRPRTRCWWIIGGGSLYPGQIAGWLPREALPSGPDGEEQRR